MNVNGSRFILLLGVEDWGRCIVQSDGAAMITLADAWGSGASPPEAAIPVAWDAVRNELRLQPISILLGAIPGETPPTLDGRRGAAADRYGNIYWISDDRESLRVFSVGSATETAFWPDALADLVPSTADDFTPDAPVVSVAQTYTALAVTEDHYLVTAYSDPSGPGLLVFDLMSGGPPVRLAWPSLPFEPFDMARRIGGGVWVLDRVNARLWELDRYLAVVSDTPANHSPAPATDVFQMEPSGLTSGAPSPVTLGFVDLRTAAGLDVDPIAVDAAPGGSVMLLDRNGPAGLSRVFRLRREKTRAEAAVARILDGLAQDLVIARTLTRAGATAPLLLVADALGTQALAYSFDTSTGVIVQHVSPELYPMRRFAGRALIDVRGMGYYDSGATDPRWVPIVQQPRARYLDFAELTTPIFDSGEPGCVWDRIMLDASIPAGTSVELMCVAVDERPDPEMGVPDVLPSPWMIQPAPYLRDDGTELPWLRREAGGRRKRGSGTGTWELLLQQVRGRYLQLRLRLRGPGTATPSIRALRAWYPRFSYPMRFLPAVFREDPQAASFLERFLANFEGMNTALEERIVQVQALFDPRIAPAEALDWLADWFDLALDPSWDEWRRRLLIRYAMSFFRWRGTVHGLHLALAFAFNRDLPCPPFTPGPPFARGSAQDAIFDDPGADDARLHGIRIVETFLTRRVGPLAAGDPGMSQGPRVVAPGQLWTPNEGNSGLVERYARFLGRSASPAEQVLPFSLIPPTDAADLAKWSFFCQTNLGFVPAAGAQDRQRWQQFLLGRVGSPAGLAAITAIDLPADWPTDPSIATNWGDFCASSADTLPLGRWQEFLERRYRRIDRLNAAHQTSWPSFDVIALPDHLPGSVVAQADWLQFEGQVLPMAQSAHRFSVLLPLTNVNADPADADRQLLLAQRIVDIEKPAHTISDVRFYWALNRVGEARLGTDTLLDVGSRAPQLIPDAVLGRAYIGASFVGGPPLPREGDRRLLRC